MIFNQISKQISNSGVRRSTYNPHNYQPSTHQSRFSNTNYLAGSRASENGSAISQMNQKIMDNLDHLKYKDYARESLKNSRTSNRSNRSIKSHNPNYTQQHSIRKPIVEVASKFRFNDVRTPDHQHYFPVRAAIKPEFSTWEKPTLQRPIRQHAYTQPVDTQYRQAVRKPITIEQYNQKYNMSKMDRPRQVERNEYDENDIGSPVMNRKGSNSIPFEMFRTNSNERFEREPQEDHFSNSMPVKRDWAASFGQSFGKEVPKMQEPKYVEQRKAQSKILFRPTQAKIADDPPVKASPLELTPRPPSKLKGKVGLIVAAVVMLLGLTLFTLQTIK